MELTQQEKDELFEEFAVHYAELERSEKRLVVAKNRHVLNNMSNEYYRVWRSGHPPLSYKYKGIYSAYLKLRAAVPFMVAAKKYARAETIEGADARRYRYSAETVELEDEDIEEATKAGKILLDALHNYLMEE